MNPDEISPDRSAMRDQASNESITHAVSGLRTTGIPSLQSEQNTDYMDIAAHFKAHRARVYRWAFAMCGRHEDALDIVQEVFVRMVKSRPCLPNIYSAIGWLRQVTSNIVIDRWRSESGREALKRDYLQHGMIFQSRRDSDDLSEKLQSAIRHLSQQQRLVVMAKVYDQKTFEQVAAELGISVSTAKTHYLRALKAVRANLGNVHGIGRKR